MHASYVSDASNHIQLSRLKLFAGESRIERALEIFEATLFLGF